MITDRLYLKDGSVEYPYDIYEFLGIVEDRMGIESRNYLEEFLEEYTSFDIETGETKEIDENSDEYIEVLMGIMNRIKTLKCFLDDNKKYKYHIKEELTDLEHFIAAQL